ncbi:MAG: single-stranded-DNA-specific exonuclease RecJ [Bacteroidota bacterium]
MVYGDYDVDGTTSVALFFGFLNSFHFNSDFYIPDRYKEGYGISKQGIDYAADNGYSLIVALDCGIKSVDLITYADSRGVDFIICDHHLPGDELPKAVAILDPKRVDCEYPFKELSGCGVGFKLMEAICNQLDDLKIDPFDFLDLVVVSIASDIVPIVGENRTLAYLGLERLAKAPRPGLKALMHLAGIKGYPTITKIVFGLAPRINAAGRVSHAKTAVELLLANSEDEAFHYGQSLNLHNKHRRDVDEDITYEAITMIEDNPLSKEAKTTVLFKKDWHKGVIGIVASRCIEQYYRPTIILTESNNKATGSARSVPGFDVYQAIDSCSDLLDQYGGHKFAAGLTMSIEKVQEFQERFEEVVNSTITEELLTPSVEIDTHLNFDNINANFFDVLSQMEPFGPENLHPVFITEDLFVAGSLLVLKDKHLKLTIGQKNNNKKFEAIGFNLGYLKSKLEGGQPFKMAYSIEKNEFRGVTSIQLNIKDIKLG